MMALREILFITFKGYIRNVLTFPSTNIVSNLTKIGGLVTIFKIVSLVLYYVHQRNFESSVSNKAMKVDDD